MGCLGLASDVGSCVCGKAVTRVNTCEEGKTIESCSIFFSIFDMEGENI